MESKIELTYQSQLDESFKPQIIGCNRVLSIISDRFVPIITETPILSEITVQYTHFSEDDNDIPDSIHFNFINLRTVLLGLSSNVWTNGYEYGSHSSSKRHSSKWLHETTFEDSKIVLRVHNQEQIYYPFVFLYGGTFYWTRKTLVLNSANSQDLVEVYSYPIVK